MCIRLGDFVGFVDYQPEVFETLQAIEISRFRKEGWGHDPLHLGQKSKFGPIAEDYTLRLAA